MNRRYAANTDVPADRSKVEIERLLQRYGAAKFASGWDQEQAYIAFQMHGRHVRFILPLPDRNSREFTETPSRKRARDEQAAFAAWEQACRQRWRALALVVKAKLEAVEAGITTMDAEFLNWVILPGGRTVGEIITPQIEEAYTSGRLPQLPPGAT